MLWRVAARVVTGPLAFLAAAIIDIVALLAAATRAALRKRIGSAQP